jgi:predicted component of type VI protein secretion system
MRQLQPVIWMKGTFLSPQHLQTQDRFIESTLRFHTEALSFRPWGFGHVRIDHEQLAAGHIAIASATGIVPHPIRLRRRSRLPKRSTSIRTSSTCSCASLISGSPG